MGYRRREFLHSDSSIILKVANANQTRGCPAGRHLPRPRLEPDSVRVRAAQAPDINKTPAITTGGPAKLLRSNKRQRPRYTFIRSTNTITAINSRVNAVMNAVGM
jgi:hypothetical protein